MIAAGRLVFPLFSWMLKIGGTKNAIRNGKVFFIQQFASERLSRKKFLHNLIGEKFARS